MSARMAEICLGAFAILIAGLWLWSCIDSARTKEANDKIWERQSRDL